jgi:hypothetical protein
MPPTASPATCPAILLGTHAAQLQRTRDPWPRNCDARMHIATFFAAERDITRRSRTGAAPKYRSPHRPCAAGRGHRRACFLRRSDRSKRRFWARREDDDQIGFIAARTRAIFGRSCAAEPHLLIEQLGKDEAITDADADASAAAGGVGISRSTTRPGRTTRRSPGTAIGGGSTVTTRRRGQGRKRDCPSHAPLIRSLASRRTSAEDWRQLQPAPA